MSKTTAPLGDRADSSPAARAHGADEAPLDAAFP